MDYNSIVTVNGISGISRGIRVDCGKLLKYLADDTECRECISAIAYTTLVPANASTNDALVKEIYEDGFIVKHKAGESSIDPLLGIEMVMDIVRIACQLEPDIIVLVSDNPSFAYVTQYIVKELSIRVEVAGFTSEVPEISSNHIGYINLGNVLEQIGFISNSYVH